MWVIRWIFWVVMLLFMIYFAMQNTEEMVRVNFFVWRTQELPLWMVMFLSFAVGILVWLIASIFKIVKLQNEVRLLNKENNVLRKEVDELRNIPLEEDMDTMDDIEKGIL